MSLRTNRVSEQILHELSNILRKDYKEEATLITIVGVVVSDDLQFARVRFSVIGDENVQKKCKKFMSSHKNILKYKLAEKLKMKYTIDLTFEITNAIESGNKVIQLLEEIEHETL